MRRAHLLQLMPLLDVSKAAHQDAFGVLAEPAVNARCLRAVATECWDLNWHHRQALPVVR